MNNDLISREALRKEVTEKVNFTTVDGHIAYDKMLQLIDNAPTVEPERPQGEWIKGFIDALDKAFLMFDANCVYSGERVLQILEKLKWLEKLKEEKGGAE